LFFRSIALWGTLKKKPLFTLANAHLGQTDAASSADSNSSESLSDEDVEPDDISSQVSVNGLQQSTVTSCSNSVDFLTMQKENWVTSVAALHNTDLVVSGKKRNCLIFCFRSTPLSRPNKVGLKCSSARLSTRSFLHFSEIWYVGRGR